MTIENAKIFMSKEIASMCKTGFGSMEAPLRTALFTCVSSNDWENIIIPVLLKNYPELWISQNKVQEEKVQEKLDPRDTYHWKPSSYEESVLVGKKHLDLYGIEYDSDGATCVTRCIACREVARDLSVDQILNEERK